MTEILVIHTGGTIGMAPGPDGLPPVEVCNVDVMVGPSQTETSHAHGVLAFDYGVRTGPGMGGESPSGICDAAHDCQLVVFLAFDARLQTGAPRVSVPLTFA